MDSSTPQPDTTETLTLDLTSVHSLQRINAMTNVVKALNESRMQSRRPNLIPALSDAFVSQGSDSRSVQLTDALKIITDQILDDLTGELETVAPRAFRSNYIERKDLREMRKKLCEGSQKFLETLAWALVVNEVAQHPQEARVGGIPSVVHRVRGFLNIRFKEGTKWNSDLTVRPPVLVVDEDNQRHSYMGFDLFSASHWSS